MNTRDSFFIRVDYPEFRRRLNLCPGRDVRHRAWETVIYDGEGDILGIVHAASIDENGRVHPTEYYLRRLDPPHFVPRLVA